MLAEILIFIASLVFLVKGSDFFVKAAAAIAKKLGVSEFMIGLTLVAFGTSIPELASSIFASAKGETELVIGSVVGSNIANVGLIIGVLAVFVIVRTKKVMIKRDGYIMLFASVVFYLLALDGSIVWYDSLILLLIYTTYIFFLFETRNHEEKQHFRGFMRYFFRFGYLVSLARGMRDWDHNDGDEEIRSWTARSLFKDFIILLFSGIAIVLGANYLIEEAIFFASLLNVPETVIGISMVAVGTSLPELSVTLSAARKGFANLAVGNVVGSNIANILLVVGVTGLINPLEVIKPSIIFIIHFMLLLSLLLLLFIKSDWEIRRPEGVIFLLLYFLFIVFLFVKVV